MAVYDYADATQVKAALASHLKIAVAAMPSYYDDHIVRAVVFATSELKGRLLARGFRLIEDVLLFDRNMELSLDLACWKALMSSGMYSGFDPVALKALDRCEELDVIFVFVNGILAKPALGAPGMVATSGMVMQNVGVFRWNEDDSENHGIHW